MGQRVMGNRNSNQQRTMRCENPSDHDGRFHMEEIAGKAKDIPQHVAVYPGDADGNTEVCGASEKARQAAKQHDWKVLAILSLLMGFASLSTDLYLPAMPAMSKALGAAPGLIEWTVSGYLIGFSLGQLLWGPISDRYGRRRPIAVGLLLFIIGSAGCALSGSISAIIFWRVIQAIGACASVVLARAIVRDLYDGPQAARLLSTLITVMAIAPLIGPSIGGQILVFAGWRMIFWLLVAVGMATLVALYTLPETLAGKNRSHKPLTASLASYWELLQHRNIFSFAGASGFFYGGVYAYIAGSPFAFISYYHFPSRYYGLLFALSIVGIMVCNMINTRIVERFGGVRIMVWGGICTAISGIVLVITGTTDVGGLAGLVVPIFFFASMNGLIVANSIAGALDNHPNHAGAVSALLGSIQYGSGIISSGLVGFFADGTPWPMCAVIAVCGVGTYLFAISAPRSIESGSPTYSNA